MTMGKINLLDCTLRDGGYINNWRFGEEAIPDMIEKLEQTKVDVLEIGFLKNEPYQKDRTVFNSMEQVKALIPEKKPGIQYAVMCEVVNPLPLDMLAPADAESADIIRVIVWKTEHDKDGNEVDALEKGFAYCRGIIERGYKLCVQPARVSQYSDTEFVSMVKRFSELDPMAIYVVDSWGTENAEKLLHYMHLADDNMPAHIAIGYHGHNNMMQALGVSQAMIQENFNRDIMIDASVYGIGRGAGNLDLELIIDFLNAHYGKSYIVAPALKLDEKYIKPIFCGEPWGYSEAYALSAKYNCNPAFARYFSLSLNLPSGEIEEIFASLQPDEKVVYSELTALELFRRYRRAKWEKKLAVIVPTANRSESIHYLLEKNSKPYSNFGIDLIIYDSSSDDKTELITKKYMRYKGSTTKYFRYDGIFDGVSLDQKIIAGYQQFIEKYEYIWFCRDGCLINIWGMNADLYQVLSRQQDVVIVYDYAQNEFCLPHIETYDDCCEVLQKHCCHMTILGSNIVSSDFIKKVIEYEPIDEIKNYGMWQPLAFFQYWATHTLCVISYVGRIFDPNIHGSQKSFWNKNGTALRLWGKRWYEMITSLPGCYDVVKNEVIQPGMADFTPFAPWQLVIMRATGSLTFRTFKQNQQYLESTANVELWRFKLCCLLPRTFCRYLTNHPDSIIKKSCKKAFFVCRGLYRKWFKKETVPSASIDNYDLGKTEIRKSAVNELIRFKRGKLAIIIPTADRADVIANHLKACAKLYSDYDADIIVFDSSNDTRTKDIVECWQQRNNINIRYEKYINHDLISLDEKVIAAYEQFADDYEYLWVLRDKSGILMNNCACSLMKHMGKNVDAIVVYNSIDERREVCREIYTDCRRLFLDEFNLMTTLGQTIVRGSFIKKIIREVPLSEKNYGMWQPIAFFEYIAHHDFKIAACSGSFFKYDNTALAGSFWHKQIMWQWILRFYEMLKALPSVYNNLFYQVLLEWNDRYPILCAATLLKARSMGGVTPEEVEEYKEIIPLISPFPVKYYEKISKMSPRKARKLFSAFGKNLKSRKSFSDVDYTMLGEFEATGN